MSNATPAEPKKKGGLKRMILLVGGVIVVLGAGIGGGVYAASAGLVGNGDGHAAKENPNQPKLVKRGEEGGDHAEAEGEGHGGGAAAPAAKGTGGEHGTGGDPYASTYYPIEKEFTSNLKDSTHYVQVSLALATSYDSRVIDNVKANEIPIRSAVLMVLSDASEEAVFTQAGKEQLSGALKGAINKVLLEKEGFGGIGNVYFTNFIVQ